jgi:dethiobiotin synthetase
LRIFITGTDTGVGKTIFSSALAAALRASYWKPIQAGRADQTDSDTVRALSGLPPTKVLAEGYCLATACSPHRAAELDRVRIDCDALQLPGIDPLVVEGAGGLMVPVTREILIIDLIARWRLPAVLVARTSLGTINHSLLSIHALRSRNIEIMGVAFVGGPAADTEEIICTLGEVKRLGRLPSLEPLHPLGLSQSFATNFRLEDFQ